MSTLKQPQQQQSSPTGILIAKYFVAFLMCVVAISQNIQAHTINLTSWKGGGFGLFASLDHLRFIKIYRTNGRLIQPLSRSKEYQIPVQRFVALPNELSGNRAAKTILEVTKSPSDYWVQVATFDVNYDRSTSVISCEVMTTGDSRGK